MDEIMTDMDKIYKKLVEMQEKPVELRKVFNFTVENLQDNPEIHLREIREYLDTHSDKIEDFYFENYIDEETFSPVLVMHVLPNEKWRSLMMKNSIFENLIPVNKRISLIRERLQQVMNAYVFEFNDEKTRKHMAADIQRVITFPGKYPEVIDITTSNDIDAGKFKYIVSVNENEMTIEEYLRLLADE